MSKKRAAPEPSSPGASEILGTAAAVADAQTDDFTRELEKARELRGARPPSPPTPVADPTPPTPKGPTIMVIGDSHACAGESLRRYRWFGKMAATLQPEVIVSMGDWADMSSCATFDRPGSVKFRALDFYADIDAAVAAREVFEEQLQAARKYQPRKLETIGNHEYRILRVSESDHRFAELFTLDLLQHAQYGWERYDFLQPVTVCGFTFQHYFCSPGTNRAVAGTGANPSRLVWQKIKTPSVRGHSHRFLWWRETNIQGDKFDTYDAGCSTEYDHEWAGADNRYWDRGILMLRNAHNGTADHEWWSLERVRREFGP